MPRNDPHTPDSSGFPAEPEGGGENSLFRLLRNTHIFTATFREILETNLIRSVTPLPLTVSQVYLLKMMATNGQHQVGEVADFLGVSAPAATKNVDKLERLRLVSRSPSTGDRRATLLSLTPRGRHLVREYDEQKRKRLDPLRTSFKRDEIDSLSDLLEKFSLTLLRFEQHTDESCLRCAAYIEDGCLVGQIRGGCPYRRGRSLSQQSRPQVES